VFELLSANARSKTLSAVAWSCSSMNSTKPTL
jgi:hypothetical protein